MIYYVYAVGKLPVLLERKLRVASSKSSWLSIQQAHFFLLTIQHKELLLATPSMSK